ncbi:MAG: aspartyl protease family protein [Pirellulales bacterium]
MIGGIPMTTFKVLGVIAATILCCSIWFLRANSDADCVENVVRPIAEIATGKGGRPLLVPVDWDGSRYSFLLDTGAARTVFDTSLRSQLGAVREVQSGDTSAGQIALECFDCPPAKVGGLDLQVLDQISCADLSRLRQTTGKEIHGIVGIDFLKNYAIEIRFDDGTVSFFAAPPKNWGNARAISLQLVRGVPHVTANFAGVEEAVIVDTGANASYLSAKVFDGLVAANQLRLCAKAKTLTLAGGLNSSQGYVSSVRIGALERGASRFSRDSFTGLGLQSLSRFIVRIDFPGAVAYFAPGRTFGEPDSMATSGAAVLEIGGQKTIISTEPGGAADVAGLSAGDVVTRIDGRLAESMDMHEVGELLTSEVNREIEVQFRRYGVIQSTAMVLKSRF